MKLYEDIDRLITEDTDELVKEFTSKGRPNPLNPRQVVFSYPGGDVVAELVANRHHVLLKDVRSTERQKGLGSKFMEDLTGLADEYGVEIRLHVVPYDWDDGSETGKLAKDSFDKLYSFYKRFGFRDYKKYGNERLGVMMSREPEVKLKLGTSMRTIDLE